MIKTRKIILAILIVVLVVLIAICGYRSNIISKAKTGCLIYADESIVVINLNETTKKEYNINGYSNLNEIGQYYGGDFCCVAVNNETNEQEILLFKNGVVEKSYPVIEKIISISVYNDKVYYLTEDGCFNCVHENETELIESNIEEFALNNLGEIAYIKEIPDDNYSAEDSINGELYYYVNGTNKKLGEAYRVQWLTDRKLLVGSENVFKEYGADGELISVGHSPEDYIVTIGNNEWTYSKGFNKVPPVACLSPNGKKSVVYYSDEGFTTLFFGIYDIERDICDKNAIYDGINNKDVFDDMGANILWLEENPME